MYDAAGKPDYDRMRWRDNFQDAIAQLAGMAARRPTAILCAEEDPSQCHRLFLLGPPLSAHGVALRHIRRDGNVQETAQLPLSKKGRRQWQGHPSAGVGPLVDPLPNSTVLFATRCHTLSRFGLTPAIGQAPATGSHKGCPYAEGRLAGAPLDSCGDAPHRSLHLGKRLLNLGASANQGRGYGSGGPTAVSRFATALGAARIS